MTEINAAQLERLAGGPVVWPDRDREPLLFIAYGRYLAGQIADVFGAEIGLRASLLYGVVADPLWWEWCRRDSEWINTRQRADLPADTEALIAEIQATGESDNGD
ncbi:hypothetical protein [Ruegeria atlantica]|uniref:hypothetical protein n=1 Tax=Ruegeria atlantica TaxID=81569 RepID=UPI0014801CCC|nr:hypothetical protein [Ruegeria atlantica]